QERNEIDALVRLHAELHQLDLDGYLIVPAVGTVSSNEVLSNARERLLNRRWRRLSEMFDGVVAESGLDVTENSVRREGRLIEATAITRRNLEQTSRECEEGAQA